MSPTTSSSLPIKTSPLAAYEIAKLNLKKALTPADRRKAKVAATEWLAATARNAIVPRHCAKAIPAAPTGYITEMPDAFSVLSQEDLAITGAAIQKFLQLARRLADFHNIDTARKDPATPEHIREGLNRIAELELTADTGARSHIMATYGKSMSTARDWLSRELAAA